MKTFSNTYKLSNHDISRIILFVQKKCLPTWIYGWLKNIEWDMITREIIFLHHLNMEDTIDSDYTYTKWVCKNFKIKKLSQYQNLYVQSDTLLLTDVFNSLQNICPEIYGLNPAQYFRIKIDMASSLNKRKVKLDQLTDINMLLMVEKAIMKWIIR